MTLEFINEFEISAETSKALNLLLQKVFPDIDYQGRDYFKQLPHYRILAKDDNHQIVGHLGINYRAMNLNDIPIKVFGVAALCVDPNLQRKGIGKTLLAEFEKIARNHSQKIDFLFLVTDEPQYYQKLGYQIVDITTTWLKIHQHKNYGLETEKIDDASFLIKSISEKRWENGDLDMLGFMY